MILRGDENGQWMKEEGCRNQEKPFLLTAALLVTSVWTVHYTITLGILLSEANVIATFKGPVGAWDA